MSHCRGKPTSRHTRQYVIGGGSWEKPQSTALRDQVYRLEAGDCLLLEATQLYAYHNVSQVPAIVLVIFQAAQVHGFARQHH